MTEPQKTTVAPQKTAVAPQKTAVAPQKTAAAPQATSQPDIKVISPVKLTTLVSSGAEADIETFCRGLKRYARKTYHHGFHPNTRVTDALKHLGGKGLIADIYESGTDPDGQEYELMEYFPAGSLVRYDLRGNSQAITAIILRTATALDAIHRSNVIHKDVKPANILVKDTATWECVLCDFGIADILSGGKAVTKQSRTPIYAAPEIYDPSRAKARIDGEDFFEITPAADFYALGITALSLWSGEEKFLADEEKIAVAKLGAGIAPPKNMPDPLRNIVAGLLKKNPAERWNLKDIEDSLGGHWAVMHIMNPLADVKLNANPKSKDYAMTGPAIGAFLNKVYMWQFSDAKAPADAKLCQTIVDSFSNYEGSYMQLFFASKGRRFEEQDRWMEYCCNWESGDNAKKAGPQDEDTRLEISMMKTIKGFGFTPYYEFENDTVTFLDEFKDIDPYDRKYGLTHGLKGWLAVQYHENPDADLSENYAYELLLDKYISAIEDINPDATECACYRYACEKADELERKLTNIRRRNRRKAAVQTVLDITLAVLPMVFIILWVFSSFKQQEKFLYWIVLFAAIALLVCNVIKVLLNRYTYTCEFTFGGPNTDGAVSDFIEGREGLDIGMEELVVEPLYYAFSDEKDFDSSLNGYLNNHVLIGWADHLETRGKKIRKHILTAAVVFVLACLILPRPAAVMHSDNPKTETTELNEQVQ